MRTRYPTISDQCLSSGTVHSLSHRISAADSVVIGFGWICFLTVVSLGLLWHG